MKAIIGKKVGMSQIFDVDGKVIPVTKVVLEAQGFSVGNAAFPMTRYSDDQKRDIIERMKKAGLEL